MNNLALFITHHIFLSKKQIEDLYNNNSIETIGHSVPVWVDAKTGETTEPAKEIFCNYKINNTKEYEKNVEIIRRKGYELFLPQLNTWQPPEKIEFDKLSQMTSEERIEYNKKRDLWWKKNPKPLTIEDLVKSGYLRFEVKVLKQSIDKYQCAVQHVIEIKTIEDLESSLTT